MRELDTDYETIDTTNDDALLLVASVFTVVLITVLSILVLS